MNQIEEVTTNTRTAAKAFIGCARDRRTLLVTAVLLIALTVSAFVTFNRDSAADTRSAVIPALSLGQKDGSPPSKEKVRTERVTAFRHGFEPEEITRTGGQFMLCVDNRAGAEPLSLQLTSGTYGPVYASAIQKGKSGTNELLNLQPGQYTLTESSHPEWVCTITITAK